MVDKPKGKTEILVDKFFRWCRETAEKIGSKTEGHRHVVRTFRERHPKISRTIVVSVCTVALGAVIVGFATPKTVVVNIDDSNVITTTTYETTSRRVDSFIENHQIDYVYGQDVIDAELYSGISDNMEINIQKAVQIPVTADGQTNTVTTLPVTVGELLEELDIKVGENDIVEPAQDHVLEKGDELFVRRVTTDVVVEEAVTDYEIRYQADYSMSIGKTEVVQEGSAGRVSNTYDVVLIDGVEESRTLRETTVLQEKQDRVIAYGMNISSGVPSGLQYKTKISGVKAVSYYFPGTPKGAYGLPCTYGTCAVDKNVIPLGSLLYIEGYGYAIANDVGSAIKGKTVDLYMEDLSQCYTWGARSVNVYVIS